MDSIPSLRPWGSTLAGAAVTVSRPGQRGPDVSSGFPAVAAPRPLLKLGAVVFLLAMTGYSAALMYYNRNRFPSASLGLTGEYSDRERSMRVDRVEPAGPGARAGLTAGDRIVAVNSRPLETIYRYWDAVDRGRPGETVRLTVQRQVDSRLDDIAIELGTFRLPAGLEGITLTFTQLLALNLLSLYPIPFLVVAGIVLTQRYWDRNAWSDARDRARQGGANWLQLIKSGN
jgi:membrane-associated protease RseP (regulator of RpoE activity)